MPSAISAHPSAIIHPGASVGRGTVLGPGAVIERDACIGIDCRIAAHAVVKRYTRLGDRNQVGEGAVLGGAPQDLGYRGQPTRLLIGDDNFIGECVTAHRASKDEGKTRVGNHNRILAHAHIAHDCHLEDRVVLGGHALLAGHIHVEARATIGSAAVLHQFVRVGRLARIGTRAKVQSDALPFATVAGIPARTTGLNRRDLEATGLSADELDALAGAFETLSRRRPGLSQRLTLLTRIDSEAVQHLLAFIQRSQRGFCPFVDSRAAVP